MAQRKTEKITTRTDMQADFEAVAILTALHPMEGRTGFVFASQRKLGQPLPVTLCAPR